MIQKNKKTYTYYLVLDKEKSLNYRILEKKLLEEILRELAYVGNTWDVVENMIYILYICFSEIESKLLWLSGSINNILWTLLDFMLYVHTYLSITIYSSKYISIQVKRYFWRSRSSVMFRILTESASKFDITFAWVGRYEVSTFMPIFAFAKPAYFVLFIGWYC